MNCPNDGSTLQLSDRSGIEIDYCPQCRGVWLDRGELDKILERESQYASPRPSPRTMRADDRRDDGYRGRGGDHGYGGHGDGRYDDGRYGNRRRGGFLSDLFGD